MDRQTESLQQLNTPQKKKSDTIPTTLVVGDMTRWRRLGTALPVIDSLTFVDLNDISTELLTRERPDIVLSPLYARNFDAVELARRLAACGFAGRYRVVTDNVPDQSIIEAEVRAAAPDIDFGLVMLPDLTDP